jgi:hypothetical protein
MVAALGCTLLSQPASAAAARMVAIAVLVLIAYSFPKGLEQRLGRDVLPAGCLP